MDAAPIVITANGLMQRGSDSSYAFAQDANFWYLTGIDEPDVILVMDRDKEYLIVPPRDASRTAFDGAIDDNSLTSISGIAEILETEDGWNQLANRIKKVQRVATIAPAPAYIERYGLYANPARAQLTELIRSHNANIALLDLSPHLIQMRVIKQPAELKAIQSAIDITIAAIKAASTASKRAKYSYEYELEAEITRGFRARGATGHSFEPIVAGGVRACTLHNVSNNGQLAKDELVIMDVGAEVDHYAADISRTISLTKPSKRQQAVHAAVVEVQKFAYGRLKPGIMMADYEQEIMLFMGKKLRSLGLITSIDHDSVRKYYPHATSHFLGLNVHDAGDYSQPLQAGMVVTVEPGIYIAEEGIGIRIEDDVLITPKGIKILSRRLSNDLTIRAV
ncbi:MAG: hypothetical protein JWM81_261 [Candidatus Saccharibacteria bacterium]|nr:hypothetical protein [Candidatus Saccharibacteria bacterium]